jgi:hypothetical protein
MTPDEIARLQKISALEAVANALDACLEIPGWHGQHRKRIMQLHKRVVDISFDVKVKPFYDTARYNYDYE